MGACFNEMIVQDKKVSWNTVFHAFEREQEQDRYENGHSYSGGFGMACGLKTYLDKGVFENSDKARDWLQDTCQKWEEARAVRFLDHDGEEKWMIGAWCAS